MSDEMEGNLEDYKFITEIWKNADILIEGGVPSAIEAGKYAQRALRFTDLDNINNTEVEMSMNGINDGEAFDPSS